MDEKPGKVTKENELFQICGTTGYMAPEIESGDGYEYGVDIYALGVLTHETLLGTLPSSTCSSSAPTIIRCFIEKCIAPKQERYKDMESVLKSLFFKKY